MLARIVARILARTLPGALPAALLAACQVATIAPPAPRAPQAPVGASAAPAAATTTLPSATPQSATQTAIGQVRFEADGAPWYGVDDAAWVTAWPAWIASCGALTAASQPHRQAWLQACADALAVHPADGAQVRAFFAAHMDAYRVIALDGPGRAERDTGLVTGYYEPQIEARRMRGEPFVYPVYRLPPVLPLEPRAELEASGRLRGQELLWLRDPVEAFFLEVQGSGKLQLGPGQWTRLAYAGSNGQPYRSIGRWLVERGELPAEHVSMQAIADWARAHPQRVRELLDQDPRVIFFREQPIGGADAGPIGSLGVPLTPDVSVAVDPRFLPLGAPLLMGVDAAGPDAPPRLALAQDTGGAIVGPLRIDWYRGQGHAAGELAGREHGTATIRLLVPRGVAPQSLF
jgi:membrane-bound lytic murein transglycosylase A